jgi:hypothetical protein
VAVWSLVNVASQQLLVAGTLGRGAFTIPSTGGAGNLTVTVNGATVVNDDSGVLSGKLTITRSDATTQQTVAVVSSDPTLATVPASVSFGVGQLSTTADVTIVDDPSVARYPSTVVFSASGGANSISDALDVIPDGDNNPPVGPLSGDADTPSVSVSIPFGSVIQATGGVASVTGTVTRNTPTTAPLKVYLVSADPTEATVVQPGGGTSVTIPKGATSATFTIEAVDSFAASTTQVVTIFAAASGFASGSDSVQVNPTGHIVSYDRLGDQNITRNQGQIVIQDNLISHAAKFDISVSADPRGAGGSIPHVGVVRNLDTINGPPQAPPGGLVPGPVIENNLLLSGGAGAILYAGDSDPAGQPLAAVPFGRIVNNTIYGATSPVGTGVQVQNAAPTIINNIFANLSTAINVDGPSSLSAFHPTVVTANAYQNNSKNLVSVNPIVETNGIFLAATDALFRNAAGGDFYLTGGSPVVDSATDSLPDRAAMTAAKTLTGIPASPIFAPSYDLFGQLRATDPTATNGGGGIGSQNTKDRGAIERVDITGPLSSLADPIDNGQADQDPAFNVVHVAGQSFNDFAIRFTDTNGSGIDDSSINQTKFSLYRNGTALNEGTDYFFSYDTNTKIVHFTPAAGVWPTGSQYTIFVDNGINFDAFNATRTPVGVKDFAGNLLQPNSATGFTRYDILLQSINGDPPVVSAPLTQTANENVPLVFSGLNGNPVSIFDIEGGSNPIQVTMSTLQGTMTLPSTVGLTFLNGTANGQATVTFSGLLADVNNALSGLTYTETNEFAGQAAIQISATDTGTNLTGLATIHVTVVLVNDVPVNTLPPTQTTAENAPLVFSTATGNAISVFDGDAATPP